MTRSPRRVPQFCHRLRQAAQSIWEAQLHHPFVVALGKGTLPERKFRYYILQDARFLEDLARIFAIAAQKAPDADSAVRFAKLVEETITVERALHEQYGRRWKMAPREMTAVPMAPTTYAYTRHMLAVAQQGSAAEAAVVALPCAWVYCEVGLHLLKDGPPPEGHPYRDWLLLYGSPEFAETAAWMRSFVNRWAGSAGRDEKVRMEEAFLISSRYEWMFWEMAWREEGWPV